VRPFHTAMSCDALVTIFTIVELFSFLAQLRAHPVSLCTIYGHSALDWPFGMPQVARLSGQCRSSHRATSNPTLVWPYDVPFHPIGPRTEHMLALPRRTYTRGGRRGTVTRFTGGVSSWLLLLGVSAPVASQHRSAHKSCHPDFTCHGPFSYRRAASTNSLHSETRHNSLPQRSPDSLSYSDISLPSF
jgi:hypothetical protein